MLKHKLQWLLLLAALLGVSQGVWGNSSVYFVLPSGWNENNTIKANVKYGNSNDQWQTTNMTKMSETYGNSVVFKCSDIGDQWGGVYEIQFQEWNGGSYVQKVQAYSGGWWTSGNYSGKVYSGSSWVNTKHLNIAANTTVYFVDNDSWNGCELHIWGINGDGWSNDETFSTVSNTNSKIYYKTFTSKYEYDGMKFRNNNSWEKQSSGNITTSISSSSWFLGNSTTASTTLANMNGTAAFKSKVSTDGGASYSLAANSDCVATISGYTLSSGTSATATSGSTGSSNTATIYPAYGSTVSYRGSGSNGYEYMGCSTTNSSTLPSSPTTGTKNVTANKTSKSSLTTYYAYFKLKQYTATATVGSVSGGTVQVNNASAGSTSFVTVNHGTSVSFMVASTTSGYAFKEWNTAQDGSGTQKSTNTTYTISSLEATTTVYAIFERDCTAPTSASDITDISPSSEQTITLSGGDAPSVTQSVTATCAKGDTYLWSASPNNITYKIGDASYSTTRADFTKGTTKSATMNMYFEGEYTANFAVGCSNTSGANKNTSTIKVYPGTIYLNGPFFNGNDFNGSEYEAYGTNHNIEIVDIDNDHIFTYEWIATDTSGEFTIKTTARGGDATHILANYATLNLTGISKSTSGNHNLSPNIGTITAGDRLRLTIEYTGVDGSGVPEYDIKLKKIPVPTTDAAEDIGLISAKLKGSHPTGDVYEAITAKGFYYGTTSSPSTPVDNKTAAAGSIVRTLNSLNPGITYYYKAYVVSGGVEYCGSVLSFATTECSAPSSVTSTQMAAANYCKDAAATALEVTGSGGVTPYSYQWYSNTTASTSGGSSISGANSETYTPPTSTAGDKYYYCVVKSASPCASSTRTSDVSGLIHVDAPSATGTIQNGGSICGSGEHNRSRTLSLSGASATQYQWYSSESENTGYSAIGNATDATYVASPSEATYYKVEVKNGVCGWTTGLSVTPAQVTVDVPSVAGSIQGAGAVCDSKGNLSISGETGTSYQWQRSSDGSSFSNISGATSATYNATGEVSSGPRYYKVKVTNGACDAATSDAVRVTQGNIVTITVEPDETYITTSPYLYAWYKSGNNNIETLGNWHGTSMGALQDGVYKYTFDTKTCGDYYIIINNNDKKQTSDIHITDTGNKCFHLTGDWGNNYETCCESTSSTSVSVDENSICKGVNVTVSVTDAQDGYTYQLYTSSTAETPIETEECTSSGSISFDAVAPDATTTYYVKAYQTGTSCTPENVGNVTVTVIDPTITISGVGAKSENATYPWEYITLTATTNCSTVTWDDAVFVGGSAPAYSESKNAKTYMLKSAITARPDDDYYLIGVSGTYGGCNAEAEYKIYINQAPAEPSCN